MKVVTMLKVLFYDLSLRKAMDAARFFCLVKVRLPLIANRADSAHE